MLVRGSQAASWTVSRKPEPQDEIDLARDEVLAMGEREQHEVDDAVRGLDLGALVALQDVLDDQRVQPQRRADGLDLGG